MARTKGVSTSLALTLLSGALLLGIAATQAHAAVRHIEGTVLSKNSNAKTFKISTQSGNRLTIKVNAKTKFQRITGNFSGLTKGMVVEVEAQSTSSGLLAKHVEPKESGGSGGGGGGGGADDPPNHG
jgi:nitrous oxidase accessory protein NosD